MAKTNTVGQPQTAELKTLRDNFHRIERKEWWLWIVAFVITLLITLTLAFFLLHDRDYQQDSHSTHELPQAVRGLIGLVFLFDLYTIYQHFLIYRIRRQLLEREGLFHLISENVADMIAIVDMEGKRIYNSLSYFCT